MTKVMLVDDDELVTELLQKLLRADGFETVGISDSSKSIELAISEKPDIILLDLMMPHPDGFRVSRMIRKEPTLKDTPVIIVTALDDNDSKVVAFGAGATDYLTKPFHPAELKSKIIDILEELGNGVPLSEIARKSESRHIKKSRTPVRVGLEKSMDFLRGKVLWLTLLLLIIIFCVLLEVLK